MSTKSRAVSAKGVQEFKPYITKSIPFYAVITCADNTGAKTLRVVQVARFKGRLKRMPAAGVGDMVLVVVKKGPPDLKKQVLHAVIVRQKYPVRRMGGSRVSFEDNAAVIMTPEGELKGTDIRGPVAAEAAERWARIANVAPLIV
ncbi:MAG: 50S ribosomal protein L14 [Nitrososphaerota archaeon]|nr:50S ribosomal protein L14 [Nitrososphaerota archaeon]MDG6939505.1 50S ribosomal protein L14 [Nitrososphaerota archaeon]